MKKLFLLLLCCCLFGCTTIGKVAGAKTKDEAYLRGLTVTKYIVIGVVNFQIITMTSSNDLAASAKAASTKIINKIFSKIEAKYKKRMEARLLQEQKMQESQEADLK